jgi:hypothetical protein
VVSKYSQRITDPTERRANRRMCLRLPAECRRQAEGGSPVIRSITHDISTGGLYLELGAPDFGLGDKLEVELTVPPAEGVSPYQGRVSCRAEVVRLEPPRNGTTGKRSARGGFGVAARFLDRLRISY